MTLSSSSSSPSPQNPSPLPASAVVDVDHGPNRPVAAFFDFDKTILAGDCAGSEAMGIWDRSWNESQYWLFLKLSFFATIIIKLYEWQWIGGAGINKIYCRLCYKGMLYQDLKTNSQRLYASKLRRRLYPEMLQKMQEHHQRGHLVYVVSASPIHLLQPFVDDPAYCDFITGLSATEIDVDPITGQCTGHVRHGQVCIGAQKRTVQRHYALERNIDLNLSYAYSDHHHDLEFLEAVKYATVVNPTDQLEDIARQRQWKTMRLNLKEEEEEKQTMKKGDDDDAATSSSSIKKDR